MIFCAAHKNEPEAMNMEKRYPETTQQSGRVGVADFAADTDAGAGSSGADGKNLLPLRGRAGEGLAGTRRRRQNARGIFCAVRRAVRGRRRCSRRLPSPIRRLPVKRLEIAPGFIAALCLLRLLVEPGVFWSFLAAAAAHEAGHLTAAFALRVKVTGIWLDALDARIRMQASSYRQETICALAGPAASALLCIAMRKSGPCVRGNQPAAGAF